MTHPELREAPHPTDLANAIANGGDAVGVAHRYLTRLNAELDRDFLAQAPIRDLIRRRALGVDRLLRVFWHELGLENIAELALIAVGGYGRTELHPYSDVDLLILAESETVAHSNQTEIERFVALLWDSGFQLSHAVRVLRQCEELARTDLTVVTNLIESRLLAGSAPLFEELQRRIGPSRMWSSEEFFQAKREEQIERHRRFAGSEYNLEPNLKSCPGGMRDIQMIGWVAKRHFATRTIRELVSQGFVTAEEYDALIEGQDFLWRLRYGLHMLAKKPEDRLLFDYQEQLAKLFGFKDDEQGIAIEHLMKSYYRWALRLGTLNEMLTQLLDEAILKACRAETILDVNKRFHVRNGYLEAKNNRVFVDTPYALIEIFVLLAQHSHIEGIRASTIRQILQGCQLIDENFRRDSFNNQLFMKLLGSPHEVTTQLRRMHRYGVLGGYLPEFARVSGMMQHDLFHILTVDAHTLQVVGNLRRFLRDEEQKNFPIASQIMLRLPRPELVYIAGLFHDIAKGRGGDHSHLGAHDARAFCERVSLSSREGRLVAWLVQRHLVMSTTSQRRDLSDPEVIYKFAELVGDRLHLDCLYALTVADVNATNPKLWNAWRASLLRQLYTETKRVLRRGLSASIDKQELAEENRGRALQQLLRRGFNRAQIRQLWTHLGEDYLARETVADIVWQCEAILLHHTDSRPLVIVRGVGRLLEGATLIFLYTLDRPALFATITASLENLDLDVHGARIYNSSDGHIIDSFFVLEHDDRPVSSDPRRIEEIRSTLQTDLQNPTEVARPEPKRVPRQLRHFMTTTKTELRLDPSSGYTVLELSTSDRPGLLARIGQVFVRYGIQVHYARISTLGERVEDVFFITDRDGKAVNDEVIAPALCAALRDALDGSL